MAKFFIFLFICLGSQIVLANQIKIADDSSEIRASISANEINRIKTIGDRIRAVKKNDGEFSLSIDEELGDVYLTNANPYNKPLNLFINTEKGFTYKLLLLPKNIPSEQIFIKNDSITLNETNEKRAVVSRLDYPNLINLYKHLASDQLLAGYVLENKQSKSFTLKNLKLTLNKKLIGKKYIGEVYLLENKDKKEITLTENLFSNPDTIIVSFKNFKLKAKAHTLLYLIKERNL